MRFVVDTERWELVEEGGAAVPLHDPAAVRALSQAWMVAGWAAKYSYDFRWMGRPIIQLPQDLIRLQELIWEVRPTVIVETGVAHGGTAVFYAGLLRLLHGAGRVISVDIEIRPHNRAALEAHPLYPHLHLIERSSTAAETAAEVRGLIGPEDRVMVMLDSNHTRAHVAEELELYAPLVSVGSYVVVMDGVMRDLHAVPGGRPEWREDNPTRAAEDFLAAHPEFEHDPHWTRGGLTYFPHGYLRRLR